MNERREIQGKFWYQQDSKRYHRFQIETATEEGVVGTVYVPKDLKSIPKTLVLEYAAKDSARERCRDSDSTF